MSTLDVKSERFVDGVVAGMSATAAYVAAGYSPNGARTGASRKLASMDISSEVTRRRRALADAVAIDAAWIVAQSVNVVARGSAVVTVGATDDDAGHERMVDAGSVIRALTLLSRFTGGFETRTEVTGANGGPIETRLEAVVATMSTDELRESLTSGSPLLLSAQQDAAPDDDDDDVE